MSAPDDTAVPLSPAEKKKAAAAQAVAPTAPVDDLADAEQEALAAGATVHRIGNALRVDN